MSQEVVHRWLVAVEVGASWPEWLAELLARAGRGVVAQHEGEPPADFAARTLGVAAATGGLGAVLLLCNERTDPIQIEARRTLLGGLMRGALTRAGRRLVVGPESASPRVRKALTALGSGRSRRDGSVEVVFDKPRSASRPTTSRVAVSVA